MKIIKNYILKYPNRFLVDHDGSQSKRQGLRLARFDETCIGSAYFVNADDNPDNSICSVR